MRNDLVILEDERNKLLSSIELLNNNNQNIEGDNRTFSVNINRLEIKLNEQYKQNENDKLRKIKDDNKINDLEK
jgi:hypothetical protein